MRGLLQHITLLLLIVSICILARAQTPDYARDRLSSFTPHQRQSQHSALPDASVQLYCDGNNLTFVAEVLDSNIQIGRTTSTTDHLEIWFALPASVYPNGFEYRKHPDYIFAEYAPPIVMRGDPPSYPRMFSIYGEYADQLELEEFLKEFDYPNSRRIRKDSLWVPDPNELSTTQLPFGVVGFAFFPDQRPAELLFPEAYGALEEILGIRMKDWASSIVYTSELDEDGPGYFINAQISPEALGFLPLPDLRELAFLVELADKGPEQERTALIRSNAPGRELFRPSTFEKVYLQTPLYTNYSGIPDAYFYQEDWNGMLVFGEYDWHFVEVETDALVYQAEQSSTSLMEVRFRPMEVGFSSRERYGQEVKELRLRKEFINDESQLQRQLLIYHQLFRTQHLPHLRPPFTDSMFVFPDLVPGLILHGNSRLSPYGWGDCGECVEETYRIFRIELQQSYELLEISQSLEAPYYCEIGDFLSYSDYYIESFDWIYPGEVLVLRLNHRTEPKVKKRVKVSWAEDGSNVVVEEME